MPTQQARSSASRRAERAAIRREELLARAFELFCEQGYSATTTKQIARAAGVTEGLIFHYFATKLDILLELAARRHGFAGRILARLDVQRDASARELLHEFAAGFADVTRDEARFIGMMMADMQLQPELRQALAGTTGVVVQRIAALLRERAVRGELRDDVDFADAMLGFFGGFQFFFQQHRDLEGAAWRTCAGRFASTWAELCWRGMASESSLSQHSKSGDDVP